MGDGSTHHYKKNHYFHLGVIDEDFALATATSLSNLLQKKVNIFRDDNPMKRGYKSLYRIVCYGKCFCEFLENETENKSKIPTWIEVRPFIQGIMDSEGYVGRHYNKKINKVQFQMGVAMCTPLLDDIVNLMRKEGVVIGKKKVEPRGENKPITIYKINTRSWINSGLKFSIARKNSRLSEYLNTTPQRLHAEAV